MLWATVATILIVHPVATSPPWPARSNVDTKKEAQSPKVGQAAECSKYGFPDQVPSPTAPFTCLGINLGLGEVRSRPPPEVLFPATDTSVFLYPDKYKKKPAHKRTATNTVVEHPPSRFVWSHVTNSSSSSSSSSSGDGGSNDQGLVARRRRLRGTSVGRARPQVDLVAVVDPSDLPVLVGPGHALLSWVRHVRRVRTITLIGGPKELRSIVQSMRKDIARYEKAPPVHFLDSRYFNHTYGAAALSAVTTEVSASLRSLDSKQQQKARSYLRASPYRRRHHRSTSVTFDPERQRRLLLSYTTRHTHNNTGDTGDVLRTTLATVTTNATTDDDRSKSIYTATGSWRRRRRLSAEMMASVCGRQEEVPEVYRTPKRENNWQQHTPSPVTPFCGALMRLHCFDLAYLLDDVVLLQANVALASDVDLLLPNRSALYFNHLPLRLLVASAPAGGPGPAELRLWTQYKKAQAKHYSSQESEAAALHTFLGTLRQVTKEAHSSSSSTGSSDNGNGDTSSSSSTSNGAHTTGGGIVTSAQLRAWRAFKLAKSRTYHSLAEECGALSLFLATAAAASQQQEEAAKKSSSRSAQLVPGSMPTVDELRAYGAYKRLHGLNFDGDPKAEAKALHMWFKTLWGGSSGSSNRSSSTTSTSSLGTSSGMEGAPPRRMKPQLADTGSSSWSDESNLPPLVGNAPNSPASCGRLNSVKFVNGLLQGRCAIKCPGPRGARHDAGVPMVVQRDVMRGLHLAVSQAWRQPSLFVAGHACHAAGTSFTTASGGGSNGNGGGCGAGRSAAALLRHEQQQQRHEDGSSSSRLVPSDAELYYAFASCLYPQRVLDLQLSTSSSSATGVGRDFEPHASDCSEEEMTACRVKGLLLKVCPASGSPRGKQRYGTCRSRTASLA